MQSSVMSRRSSAGTNGFSRIGRPARARKPPARGAQCVAGDERGARAQMRLVLGQPGEQRRPVDVRHAHVAEDRVVVALSSSACAAPPTDRDSQRNPWRASISDSSRATSDFVVNDQRRARPSARRGASAAAVGRR